MADLRLQRRIEDEDREALEHIARALEGRVLLGPGAAAPTSGSEGDARAEAEPMDPQTIDPQTMDPQTALTLAPESLEVLLEAMPAAIGLLKGEALIYANSAFAYAFGYRSPSELMAAGGLDAILPGGAALFHDPEEDGRTGEVDAVTRSRRRLKLAFAVSTLDAAAETTLVRLIDQSDFEPEPPAVQDAGPPVQDAEPSTPQPAAVAVPALQTDCDADAASRRLDFLAKVSHEVRTPLNSVIGFTELMLQERFGAIGNPRYRGYAEDIHQSGLYALSLLNDLLDISKIEAGKFELDFTAVDVGEVVETCVASLQPLAKRSRIVLRTSLADDLPLVVADPRRLKQILLNLLTNAIKFTKEGGQVIVSGTIVEGELRVRVRDSGVGMSNNEIAYAMQPFHQLDTAPRRQSGTGLGLPLTKALVDANRARLELTSEPGVGTAADVIFPAERLFRS
ncbi:MAG TPA: HAMP domain-containing sensor histidine kinase [Methyloceanibacter sp.]|nr:HAMP domain-containing sensor histidine kinase [Methyloceanibacter sp.]